MISVGSEARFATAIKSFFPTLAAPIGLAAFLCSALSGGALAAPPTPPPVYGTGAYTPPSVYGTGAYTPPPAYGTGAYTLPPAYGTGAYTPPVYNPFYYTPGTSTPVYPSYNPPVTGGLPSVYNAPVLPFYNAPWEGGGFYFGPTGSASFLQDSD